jgi:DNA polymerase-3 subunit beta
MKFRIHRQHFIQGLQQVLNIVAQRPPMPILGNVLIEATDGKISLTTTNLDLGIRCQVAAEIKQPGGITLPVRKLADIVRELSGSDVEVEASEGNQALIRSGNSKFRIMGLGKENFPPLPQFDDNRTYTLAQSQLLTMLKRVSYAQSQDETRHILNGVYFDFHSSQLVLAATDGRRLAVTQHPLQSTENGEGKIILPGKTVAELLRLLDKGESVKISFNDRQVSFLIDTKIEKEEVKDDESSKPVGLVSSIYLVSKVVEGNYPNYQQVIPKEGGHRVQLERELLEECVRRAALVTTDKNRLVRFKFTSNQLEIHGSSQEYGEAQEVMAVEYNGEESIIAFNPDFVRDPLKALTEDKITFEFNNDVSPGVLKVGKEFLCVIMPLRLN